ncbi:ATPase family associated with various cellular activities (AAA) [Roseimaritima multifibrata]|uniref:ATPase family associated with various cellular activities (AAA) n=1 Tax=Roseimaritima multifibrata TaxID=1930274 RepID=A0A517MLG2_9BACT|nr:AAA family ATPase [Roseimaritima multifibrata]QDS95736.1 ATPase family associated with various cellular activities (AAA) [Roseimaritima multifibrata]
MNDADVSESLRGAFQDFRQDFSRLRDEVGKVIVGQQETVESVLVGLIAGGHVLLEGVPGLGKTLLVRTLADVLDSQFSRIQFTPDLMPADLLGTNVLVEAADGSKKFQFEKGPVFANVVLADEINRATPKTQSALLEAMQEHSVTVSGISHMLDGLFFVLATQNPLEMEGTYPLPEAQLDRFLFKLMVPFPTTAEMELIMDRTTRTESQKAEKLLSQQRILDMNRLARQVPIADSIRRYAIEIVMGSHPEHELATPLVKRFVRYGSSPRGAQAVLLAAKIQAILDGRFHVAREDIAAVAHAALRHRILMNFEGQAESVRPDTVIDELIRELTV